TKLLQKAFEIRFPLALRWFGPARGKDPVHQAGDRNTPLRKLRDAFLKEAGSAEKLLGAELTQEKSVDFGKDWRSNARRSGAMPDSLFEVVRFKDSEIAH
ncbi:MAG: hypothetical protein VX156_05235, partial [Pseudomonadota bacterium]|nr:hypothetical protein [Pseudomonadota bacterium]